MGPSETAANDAMAKMQGAGMSPALLAMIAKAKAEADIVTARVDKALQTILQNQVVMHSQLQKVEYILNRISPSEETRA